MCGTFAFGPCLHWGKLNEAPWGIRARLGPENRPFARQDWRVVGARKLPHWADSSSVCVHTSKATAQLCECGISGVGFVSEAGPLLAGDSHHHPASAYSSPGRPRPSFMSDCARAGRQKGVQFTLDARQTRRQRRLWKLSAHAIPLSENSHTLGFATFICKCRSQPQTTHRSCARV